MADRKNKIPASEKNRAISEQGNSERKLVTIEDYQSAAWELINSGKNKDLANQIGDFKFLNDEIAQKLIELGRPLAVAGNPESFGKLSVETNIQLLEKKCMPRMGFGFTGEYNNAERSQIALGFIKRNSAKDFIQYINHFSGLDDQVADALITAGEEVVILDSPQSFRELSESTFKKLIEFNKTDRNLNRIIKRVGLGLHHSHEMADLLIKHGRADILERHIDTFNNLPVETAQDLINLGITQLVVRNLRRFKNLDNSVASILPPDVVISNSSRFKDLDYDNLVSRYYAQSESTFSDQKLSVPQLLEKVGDQNVSEKTWAVLLKHAKSASISDLYSVVRFGLDNKQLTPERSNSVLKEMLSIDRFLHVKNVYALISGHGIKLPEIEADIKRLEDFQNKFGIKEDETCAVYSNLDRLEEVEAGAKNSKQGMKKVRHELPGLFAQAGVWGESDGEGYDVLEKTVGTDNAWRYLDGSATDRHQALHFLQGMADKIPTDLTVEVRTTLGRKKKMKVFSELLMQTAQDTSQIDGQNSYQRLAVAINSFEPAWLKDQYYYDETGVVVDGQDLKHLQFGGTVTIESEVGFIRHRGRELVVGLDNITFVKGMKPEELINVKAFYKAVERRRIMNPRMERMMEQMKEENPQAFQYYSTLIEHPTVDMGAVMEMMEDPERFLQRGDIHANTEVHQQLAPVQLSEISDGRSYIDLNPESVRDALINGTIDKMSSFKPHRQEYEFVMQDNKAKAVKERIDRLLAAVEEKGFELVLQALEKTDGTLNGNERKELERRVEVFRFTQLVDQESLRTYMQENLDQILSGKKIKNTKELTTLAKKSQTNPEAMKEFWSEVLEVKGFKAGFLLRKGHVKLAKGVGSLGFDQLSDQQQSEFMDYYKAELLAQQHQHQGEKLILTAEVLAHSDPRSATKGDDTAGTCDPFGSGKNNVYMYSPQCGSFVISFRKEGQPANEAVIAVQSTLTENQEIVATVNGGVELSEMINNPKAMFWNDEEEDYDQLDPAFAIACNYQRPVLALDNLEGHQGRIQMLMKNDDQIIERVCQQFFEEYREVNPVFKGSQVVIGKGHSKYGLDLETVPNRSVPKAAISYSDNTETKSLLLLSGDGSSPDKTQTGVSELTWRDTLAVSMIEGNAYRSKDELQEGTLDLQKILTAAEIQAERDKAPLLNFGYRDSQGVLSGYLLGYVAEASRDDKVIYFHDIAVENPEKNKTAAGRLIIQAFKTIQSNQSYQDLPIVMRARESTSYPILAKHVEKYGYEIVDDQQVDEEEETWHRLRLEPMSELETIEIAA